MLKMKPHFAIKKLDSREFSIVSLLLTMLPSHWISTLCSSVKGQKSASLSLTTANMVGLYNRVCNSGEYKTKLMICVYNRLSLSFSSQDFGPLLSKFRCSKFLSSMQGQSPIQLF